MHTPLLIIGAGPFGLAMAAYAGHHHLDHLMLGKPMDFWKSHMPEGMFLRSGYDWHLDPMGVHTIKRYLQAQSLTPEAVEPLSLAFYLDYAAWFQEQKQLEAYPFMVRRLDHSDGRGPRFQAALDDGRTITADHVVVAPGFRYFKHIPAALAAMLPPTRYTHTCDLVDLEALRGQRCLIIGGRQSALEWAALLHENGASAVHVCHRHPTPAFEAADWSWVDPLVDAMVDNPGWFRNLSQQQKDDLHHRLWAEGRLKVEPWLAPRIRHETVTLWPHRQLAACTPSPDGALEIRLDGGEACTVDHVVFATGYKVDMDRVPFLAHGNIMARLAVRNGYPVLDERFETNIPGLFITSMPATQDFGPFFAFTISVRTSARLIGRALQAREFKVQGSRFKVSRFEP